MSSPVLIRSLKDAVNRIRFRAFSAHTSLPRRLPAAATISDQFLYRSDIAANRFVAENVLALLLGRPEEVIHRLIFFDPQGKPLGEQTVSSSRYFESIPIEPIGVDNATYLHATSYAASTLKQAEAACGFSGHLQRLHRGYCLYQKTPDSIFAAVHGNFGGIVTDASRTPARHQLLARHRSTFLYTPQHHFRAEDRVGLYLMNSCPSSQTVEVILPATAEADHPSTHARFTIPSLGVRHCLLSGVEGYLSFRSRLPLCRPLVFVENDATPHHFDAFHT